MRCLPSFRRQPRLQPGLLSNRSLQSWSFVSNDRLSQLPSQLPRSVWLLLLALLLFAFRVPARAAEPDQAGAADPAASQAKIDPSRFEVTVLAGQLMRPMELAVAEDGRVFFIELDGKLKVYDPASRQVTLVGELKVTTEQENGLIGLALDPQFTQNHWVYLQYSPPDFPGQHISRFTIRDGVLALDSERLLLKYKEQRKECCHHAGSLEFGPRGELFIGTGDNTHPGGDSQGFAPIDERPDRMPYDAQKSSSNTHSYNGKILRIRPTPEGGYEIPEGNLFPKAGSGNAATGAAATGDGRLGSDGSAGLPEIYVMGCRNPWRLNVDQATGFVYWGEVGPDAGGDGPRGPRGYDEINQARRAGNFGWPYFIANNLPYADVDFSNGSIGPLYDVAGPLNESPNNTGARRLPPPQPAFIYYPYAASDKFPELGQGGRTACAGPVYHYDAATHSATGFPAYYDRVLFIYEWSRNWVQAVHLDEDSRITRIEPFLPDYKFSRPIDMQFGPEGSLYVMEYGETWGVNKDARLVRIDYIRGNRAPVVRATAQNNLGRAPLKVGLSSQGTGDKDADDTLRYEWRATKAGEVAGPPRVLSREPHPEITFTENGVYNVELVVTDTSGAQGAASVPVLVGNERPRVRFLEPANGDFFDAERPIRFRLYVNDAEDGTSDFDEADAGQLAFLDAEAPSRVSVNASLVAGPLHPDGQQGSGEEEGPLGLRLMKASDCFNCHAVDQKRVGPALLDIANKYRDQPDAPAASIHRVLNGSTGAWGKIPMIPHPQHTPEQVREMVSWVYSLKPAGAVRVFHGFTGEIAIPVEETSQAGHFILEANYLDRGAEGLPALAASERIYLRSREIQAEQADQIHGPQILGSASAHGEKFLGAINHDHHIVLRDIRLDDVDRLTARVASAGAGGRIEVRCDSRDGQLLAEFDVEVNGNWEEWYERTADFRGPAGRHDLHVRFVNPQNRNALMNLDSLRFHAKRIQAKPPSVPDADN
jgi:cytochrome c